MFIQISDTNAEWQQQQEERAAAAAAAANNNKQHSRQSRQHSKPTTDYAHSTARSLARSSTAGCSLAADSARLANEEACSAAQRVRRGSGSGLALMRSLSSNNSSSSSLNAPPNSSSTSGSPSRSESPARKESSGRRRWRSHSNKHEQEKQQQQQQQQTIDEPKVSADSEARDDLKAAFCVFDLDGDGFITLDEVRSGLKLLGETWTPNELRHVFSQVKSCSNSTSSTSCSPSTQSSDLNQQQRISIEDFVHLLL